MHQRGAQAIAVKAIAQRVLRTIKDQAKVVLPPTGQHHQIAIALIGQVEVHQEVAAAIVQEVRAAQIAVEARVAAIPEAQVQEEDVKQSNKKNYD